MDKAYARAMELAGFNPADYEPPTGRGYPQNWGQTVNVGLGLPPPAVLGEVTRGTPVSICRVECPDVDARPFDITLAMPHRSAPIAPGGQLAEMVAIIRWGQQRATSYGSDLIAEVPQECEVDWQSGTAFTVSGSFVEVFARWDNWTPIAGGVLVKQVQAFIAAHGAARVGNAHRTLWHPSVLAAGATSNTYLLPGFSKAVRLISPDTGTTFRVRQLAQGIIQTGSMAVVSGTVSPTMQLVNPSNYIEVDNIGLKGSNFALEFDLAL
jgi:hypothetical protein